MSDRSGNRDGRDRRGAHGSFDLGHGASADSRRADLRISVGVSLLALFWLLPFAHANPFAGNATAWTGPLASALLAGVFYAFQRTLGTRPSIALLCSALLTTASYLAVAAIHAPSQSVDALIIVTAFLAFRIFRISRSSRSGPAGLAGLAGLSGLALGGLLSGACAASGLPTQGAGWVLLVYGTQGLVLRWRADPAPIGVACATLATSFALVPFLTISGIAPGLPESLRAAPSALAFDPPLYASLHRLLLSPGAGILAYTPLLLLAPAAMAASWRIARAESLSVLGIAGVLILACSALDPGLEAWAAPGPRYLVSLSPLFLLPLGQWLQASRSRVRWGAVLVLGFVTAGAHALLMAASWPALIETMGYRGFSHPTDFVFMPHSAPLLGAARLAAEGRIESWLFVGSVFGIACFALAIAGGAGVLTLAARRHPSASEQLCESEDEA